MSAEEMSAIAPFDIIQKTTEAGTIIWKKIDGEFVKVDRETD